MPVEDKFEDLKVLINERVGISISVQVLSIKGGVSVNDAEHSITYASDGMLHVMLQRTDALGLGGMKRKIQPIDFQCSRCSRSFQSDAILKNHKRQCKKPMVQYCASLLQDMRNTERAESLDSRFNSESHDPITREHVNEDDITVLSQDSDEDIDSNRTLITKAPKGKDFWSDLYEGLNSTDGKADYTYMLEKACENKYKQSVPISNQLRDDLEFTALALEHNFTRRTSSAVLSFMSHAQTDLNSVSHPDSTMRKVKRIWGGSETWQTKEIHLTCGEAIGLTQDAWSVPIEYRQLSSAIHELLAAVGSPKNVKIRAEMPDDGISEACHSAKFRRTQELLYPSIREKDCPLQIILFLDETHCDEKGSLLACPLMMSLANFTLEAMATQDAITVLMYVPIIPSSSAEHTKEISVIKQTLNDACVDIVLEQVENTHDTPIAVEPFNDGQIYSSKVAVHCFSVDTKAANELTHHSQGWNANMPCRICKKLFSDLLNRPFAGDNRTKDEDEIWRRGSRKMLKKFSIKGGKCPFFDHDRALGDTQGRGKSSIFPPGPLHQHDGGEEKVPLVGVVLIPSV